MFSVDAIRGLEDIKQRLKRSATVGEVEDISTGKQLLEIGINALVVLLAFLTVLPGFIIACLGLTFVCGGPGACENPLTTLLQFIFLFVMGPPIFLFINLGSLIG